MKMLRYKKTKNGGDTDDNIQTSKVQPSSNQVSIPVSAWKVLAILSCIATMVMYAETMLIPAIPDLIKDFAVSYSMSSWILTAYLVSGAVMTPIAGKLSDIYGRKKILLIIMVIYAVGVCLAGFSSNIFFMLIARAIQGIGMSMFPIAFGIVRDKFPREKISIGQGVITSITVALLSKLDSISGLPITALSIISVLLYPAILRQISHMMMFPPLDIKFVTFLVNISSPR